VATAPPSLASSSDRLKRNRIHTNRRRAAQYDPRSPISAVARAPALAHQLIATREASPPVGSNGQPGNWVEPAHLDPTPQIPSVERDTLDSVRQRVTEYLRLVISTWWARLTFLAGAVGIVSELANLGVPHFLWWVLAGVALVLAQFSTFRHVRSQREQLRVEGDQLRSELTAEKAQHQNEIAALQARHQAEIAELTSEPPPPTFIPNMFEARLYPDRDYFVISSTDRAFVIRCALAFAIEGPFEELGSEEQQLFEDTVAGSAFEGWIQGQFDAIRAVPSDQWWQRAQPISPKIVTVARPPKRLPHYPYTLAGHCVINFKPGLLPSHPGYGVLVATAIFRPDDGNDEVKGYPLSLDDLYGAIAALETAVVEQIAVPIVEKVTKAPVTPKGCGVFAHANGGVLSEYVGLGGYHWPRTADSTDSPSLWGNVGREEILGDVDERDREIRRWIARFLTNDGYYNFETDIERLQRPTIPQPLPAG
jgi:hypothetical protein